MMREDFGPFYFVVDPRAFHLGLFIYIEENRSVCVEVCFTWLVLGVTLGGDSKDDGKLIPIEENT